MAEKKTKEDKAPLHEQKLYNVIYENWIPVLTRDGEYKEVSLLELMENSQNYLQLAGETETLNVAILRFLLAIIHKVITSMDENGNPVEITSLEQALAIWKKLWLAGELPYQPIKAYLTRFEDHFWLFHPEHPFYQNPLARIGTQYPVSKLFGDMAESNNKLRLFQPRSKEGKETCSYAEAARWLLSVNAYDDTSSKAKGKDSDGKKLESPGAGWLGRIGQVYVHGGSLFETILLNLPLVKSKEELWLEDIPFWEKNETVTERQKVLVPDNFSGMLTVPSRWLYLEKKGDRVTGYRLLGGQFFPGENASAEMFSVWKKADQKKNAPVIYTPKRHDPSKALWRSFSNYFPVEGTREESEIPGIVKWMRILQEKEVLDSNFVMNLRTSGVQYGDKDFFISDLVGDSVSVHLNLLSDQSASVRKMIQDQIALCEKLAYTAGKLERSIAIASGASGDQVLAARESHGRSVMYAALDVPFKNWLLRINPDDGLSAEADPTAATDLSDTDISKSDNSVNNLKISYSYSENISHELIAGLSELQTEFPGQASVSLNQKTQFSESAAGEDIKDIDDSENINNENINNKEETDVNTSQKLDESLSTSSKQEELSRLSGVAKNMEFIKNDDGWLLEDEDSEEDDLEEALFLKEQAQIKEWIALWHQEARRISWEVENEITQNVDSRAIFGRSMREKNSGKGKASKSSEEGSANDVHYSLPEAISAYRRWISYYLKEGAKN